MTEPDDPGTPHGGEEPRAPLPGRVVEGLREEVREIHDRIEEAVEHALPRRARWSAGKIAWILVLSLFAVVLLAAGGLLLWASGHTELLAGRLTTLLNRSLSEHSDLVLEVRDLRGNPFKRVTIIDPVVRFRGEAGAPLIEAPAMTVSYAPWDLWLGRRRSIRLRLDRPVIRLAHGADGKLRIPEWRPGRERPGPARELEVTFAMRGATVHLPDPADDITGWDAEGRVVTGGRTDRVDLKAMRWTHGPFASVIQSLTAEVASGDSTRFRVRELRTPDFVLTASGAWPAGAAAKGIHVEVDRLRWQWVARAFKNRVFDVPGQGHIVADARFRGGWSGTLAADAVWDSVPARGRGAFTYERGRLLVSGLELDSPAGRLTGQLAYDPGALELRGRVAHGDPERWGLLGLRGWPQGDLNGTMRYASWKRAPAGSRVDATLGSSVIAGWRADSARVTVQAFTAAPDSFAVTMLRRGGRVELAGLIDDAGWRGRWEAARLPLEEWPDGRASGIRGLLSAGRGAVEGRQGGLRVTGTLQGSSSEWLGVAMGRWRLEEVSGLLLPKPDLEMRAHLGDAFFLGVHFDSAAAALHVGDGRARLADVAAGAGDTLVTVAGDARWDPHGWSMVLERAAAKSGQFDWVGDPPLALAGDPQGVTFDRFAAHDGTARLALRGRWAAAGGEYDWSGEAHGLDLGRLGLPADWGLAGVADAGLRVEGRYDDPRWSFGGRASRPGVRGHRADSLGLELAGGHGRLDVRSLRFALDGGVLEGEARFGGTVAPEPDTVTGDGVRRWLASAARWEGSLRAAAMPLDRLGRLVGSAAGVSGRVSGTLALAGRPGEPELDLRATAAPVAWDSLRAERLTLRAGYRDGRLTVPELRLTRGDIVSTASGSMPLTLALGARPEVPDRAMSWQVDLENGDLALLPFLVPQIAGARGRFDLHATLAGTPHHPDIAGTARVSDGQMLVTGREERLEDIHAAFHFDQAHMTMDTLFARSGDRGTVRGRGVIDLSGLRLRDYRFDLAMRDFTTIEAGFYAAEFDGDLAVTKGPRVNGQTLPLVTGDVRVKEARVDFDFANQSETEQLAATTQPLIWTYRIHLTASHNLRWQPPDGEIEFSGDLTLEQTEKALSIWGDLRAIRGTYDFLSNRFAVRKADLTFDNVGGVNPVLDVEATTRIVPAAATPSGEGFATAAPEAVPHTITVRITDRAAHPHIAFASDPGDWGEAAILRELTVGRLLEGSAQGIGDPLDNYLTRKINEQLSPFLSKTFLHDVGQWQLARQQGGLVLGQGDVIVTVAHQVTPQVQLVYQQRLPGFERTPPVAGTINRTFERNVTAEYRINRFFYITTELAQRRALSASTASSSVPDFNVNLKARWEY
ncbi:MAG: translocation/assembly module TamB domain-containing protein [Candidatus Eisenbacteria bacterium]|nr:translocation/assembly module TamB domain-containing protein [Candidatus Eisenbacteria bacterium]